VHLGLALSSLTLISMLYSLGLHNGLGDLVSEHPQQCIIVCYLLEVSKSSNVLLRNSSILPKNVDSKLELTSFRVVEHLNHISKDLVSSARSIGCNKSVPRDSFFISIFLIVNLINSCLQTQLVETEGLLQ
jgi:hypothetical protein